MDWTGFERPALRCRACGAWGKGTDVYQLAGEGPGDATIALIGEGPGWQEEAQERNFIGRAGELLDGCLHEAGLLRAECWIANSVRCRMTNAAGKDRKPSSHELDCCRGFTVDELKRLKPKVIVALGDVASAMLLSRHYGGIRDRRGKITWSDEFNAWIIETFHPAFAIRQYAQRHFIVEDLKTARRLRDEGKPRESVPTTIEVVDDLDRLRQVRDEILETGHFAFDWETNGVHITQSLGFCLSVAIRERHAFVIPRFQEGWTTYWGRHLDEADAVLRDILGSETCTKSGWNVGLDMSITQNTLGVRPPRVTFDGMIAHHTLNNHLGWQAHGLKVCAALYTDAGRYDDELDTWLVENGWTIEGKPDMGQVWRAPNAIVWKYNGMDSDVTLRLEHLFTPQLQEEKLWKIYVEDCLPTALEHQETDREGVRIDEPYLEQISAQLGEGLTNLEREIETLVGHAVNPASSKQVAAALYDEGDLPIIARTETGQPSTKEEVLLQLKDLSPLVPLVLQHRAFAKVKGTYVDGKNTEKGQKKALRAVIDEDGYARMNTITIGTETFRFVTRKPFAIHTWPKTVPGMPSVRALIVPDDNYSFVERDFVQQEFAIQAIAAEQWDLVEAMLDQDEDIHEKVTQDLGGIAKSDYLLPIDHSEGYFFDSCNWKNRDAYDVYKKARTHWKSVGFMILFRGGARKLARMAFGCTGDAKRGVICKIENEIVCGCEGRAARYIADYYERYDKIHLWQYRQIKRGYDTGRSWGLFGTYRKLPAFFDSDKFTRYEAERQSCNFPIQNGGAHVMRRAYLKVKERFRKDKFPGRVVVTVHDQLICQVRDDLIEEGDYIVRRYMEAPYPELAGRSLRTDGVVTKRWGG